MSKATDSPAGKTYPPISVSSVMVLITPGMLGYILRVSFMQQSRYLRLAASWGVHDLSLSSNISSTSSNKSFCPNGQKEDENVEKTNTHTQKNEKDVG